MRKSKGIKVNWPIKLGRPLPTANQISIDSIFGGRRTRGDEFRWNRCGRFWPQGDGKCPRSCGPLPGAFSGKCRLKKNKKKGKKNFFFFFFFFFYFVFFVFFGSFWLIVVVVSRAALPVHCGRCWNGRVSCGNAIKLN